MKREDRQRDDMCCRLTDWVFSLPARCSGRADGLTVPERYLMLELSHLASGATGQCDPSLATLADRTGLSRATVKRTLATLERRGLIARERSNGIHRTRYVLRFGPGATCGSSTNEALRVKTRGRPRIVPGTETKRITVSVSAPYAARLEAEAEREGISLAAMLRVRLEDTDTQRQSLLPTEI